MAEYIDREAATRNAFRYLLPNGGESPKVVFTDAIDKIPAADVAPVKRGHWKDEADYDGDSVYVCSVCGETWTLIEGTPLDNNMHYCPNCGARMDGDNEPAE